VVDSCLTPEMFRDRYGDVFTGTKEWQAIDMAESGKTYDWDEASTYVKNPPFFDGMGMTPDAPQDVKGARLLALLGDSVTTDHISPAGAIKVKSTTGEYLINKGVAPIQFNSYGSRRGNHEVMMRGTFANVRIRNLLLDDVEGGFTKYIPTGEQMSIYDASMKYQDEGTPLLVIAGKEYGTGSSRDWAAKGTRLLGVKAVIAESFERIHRSNLIGMGVLPLTLQEGVRRENLKLDGSETFDLTGLSGELAPRKQMALTIHRANGSSEEVSLLSRLDTVDEVDYYRHGGILHYVLRSLASRK
jgi:aconitate hydratase